MNRGKDQRRLLPAYLATGSSSAAPVHNDIDRLSALRTTGIPVASYHTVVHRRVVDLLQGGSLTVAEVAGYLDIPVSVCLLLAEQLVADGQLKALAPLPDALSGSHASRPSMEVMEEVLSGLRALLV